MSNGLTRIAKLYSKVTKDRMVAGPHTGRLYKRVSFTGGVRFHRASARFEPPSPDTFNLVNSVKDSKIDKRTHEVFVDDQQAPYGKFLERPRLERPIMGEAGVEIFKQNQMQEEINRMVARLNSEE